MVRCRGVLGNGCRADPATGLKADEPADRHSSDRGKEAAAVRRVAARVAHNRLRARSRSAPG